VWVVGLPSTDHGGYTDLVSALFLTLIPNFSYLCVPTTLALYIRLCIVPGTMSRSHYLGSLWKKNSYVVIKSIFFQSSLCVWIVCVLNSSKKNNKEKKYTSCIAFPMWANRVNLKVPLHLFFHNIGQTELTFWHHFSVLTEYIYLSQRFWLLRWDFQALYFLIFTSAIVEREE
jgi:hypothetical protein